MFDSSFMPDGVLEVNGHAVTGLPEIHATALALIFRLDTTHLTTNVHIHMRTGGIDSGIPGQESEASLTSTVLVQHFALDKGMEPGQNSLMSGSLYRGDLAKNVDGLWKFKHLKIKATWVEGDWAVVGGKAGEGNQ